MHNQCLEQSLHCRLPSFFLSISNMDSRTNVRSKNECTLLKRNHELELKKGNTCAQIVFITPFRLLVYRFAWAAVIILYGTTPTSFQMEKEMFSFFSPCNMPCPFIFCYSLTHTLKLLT